MKGNMLIKNAELVLPEETKSGSIRIKDGVIVDIDLENSIMPESNEQFVDANGLHLPPGIIDPQVHFREPGQTEKEDLESGSKAAASGGVTAFLDMPNNKPSVSTMAAMIDKLSMAEKKCVVHHGFFIGATPDNLSELQAAVGLPGNGIAHPGICGIKIFMGSSTGDLLVNERPHLENIFSNTGGLIAVHAEDEKRMDERFEMVKERKDMAAHAEWRDDECALLATKLAVELALKNEHRLHILHLTSGLEAKWLAGIDNKKGLISVETLPQHLTFSEDDVAKEGTRLKMNPPIRYKKDREELWDGLYNDVIRCIATDHAPHSIEAKSMGWPHAPSGMPGVETSLPVMLTHAVNGKCSIEDVVKWMSTNVAELYQMVGKGKIEVGYDGDVILVDMQTKHTVRDENAWSRVGWNPFRGMELTGWPVLTVVDGVPVFQRNEETGPKGEILVEPGSVGRKIVMMPWN
ncbi:MAG: dihydroorotase [Candidatus Thermoplasmatota archaeon]|nr:dihydroorotase [Candidatus Thermoplasmatota archaeon]